MGKKLDALLRRNSWTSKVKPLVNLAISRLFILKKQRQVRCSQARSDVAQLLKLGQQESALLRVDHVIKEQNMLDVYVMLEGYCNLLVERMVLISNNKECPDELKEAISSLIFVASRCGESPELQQMRELFTSQFGKDFAARAVELRNSCEVNPKIVQKLSTRQPSLESRRKVLQEIASENGITLHLEEESFVITEQEKLDDKQKQNQLMPGLSANLDSAELGDETYSMNEDIQRDGQFSNSMKARKYRDVASAAQAAFQSAAYAAAAARAAVELSRTESQGTDPDDQSSPAPRRRNKFNYDGSFTSSVGTPTKNGPSREIEHPIDNSGSESEGDETVGNHGKIQAEGFKEKNKAELGRSISSSSSDSVGYTSNMSLNQQQGKEILFDENDDETMSEEAQQGKKIAFDESDDERRKSEATVSWSKHHRLGFNEKSSLPRNEFPRSRQPNAVTDEDHSYENADVKLHYPSQEQIPVRSQVNLRKQLHTNKLVMGSGNEYDEPVASHGKGRRMLERTDHWSSEQVGAHYSNIERKPNSVRTRVHRR